MWTLVTDIPLPNGERVHDLLDNDDQPVWTGADLCAGLAVAFGARQFALRLEGSGFRFIVSAWPLQDGTPQPEPANDPGEPGVDCLGPSTPTLIEPPHCREPPEPSPFERAAADRRGPPEPT